MIVVGTIVGWFFDRARRSHAETRSDEATRRVARLGLDRRRKHHWRRHLRDRRLLGRGRAARARRRRDSKPAGKIIGGIAFAGDRVRALSLGPGNGGEAVGVNRRDSLGRRLSDSRFRHGQTSIRRNPPNEFPDIVGPQPTNPILASFRPFIPPGARLRELTPLPLIIGTLLGMVFGASSLYLVLKVGLTVSASIPVAVISITFFRFLLSKIGLRDTTILENNIVQTAGSAGESIAFGLGVTMPAIMILGFDLEITRVMLVAILGGLIGILMMIPLRRALIVAAARSLEVSGRHGLRRSVEGGRLARIARCRACRRCRGARRGGRSGQRRQDHHRRLRDRLHLLRPACRSSKS